MKHKRLIMNKTKTAPAGWRAVKLGEVVKFGNGKARPKISGSTPIYGGNGILGYASEANYDGQTIIIGRVGAYCGSVYFADEPVWVSDNALSVKPKHYNDTHFLYYFLKNLNLNQGAEGSSHPLITQTLLNSLDVSLPQNIAEQKAIASVLSSLDDKIDLLHRQNQTLEAMAETLFRQWFVEEAQEGWEIKAIKEVVDIGIGRTPPRKEFHWFSKSNTDIKWVSIKDLADSGLFVFETAEYLTDEAVKKFNIPIIPKDTVLLSFKMTLGRLAITTEPMLSNEAIAHFRFNETTPFSKEYLYFYLKTYPYETLGSTSSIVTAINSGMIKDIEITIPDKNTLEKYQSLVVDLFDKIRSDQTQIHTLENLRDLLLPKLMSGAVRVKF